MSSVPLSSFMPVVKRRLPSNGRKDKLGHKNKAKRHESAEKAVTRDEEEGKEGSLYRIQSAGSNLFGAIGLDNRQNSSSPMPPPGFKGRVKTASCGERHSMLVDEEGGLWVAGWGQFGRLGLGDHASRDRFVKVDSKHFGGAAVRQVAAGGTHSLVVTDDGRLYSFGNNMSGQLGQQGGGRSVPCQVESLAHTSIVMAAAGFSFSLVCDVKGQVYSFGSNHDGQLGVGDRRHRFVPEQISSFGQSDKTAASKVFVRAVVAGGFHAFLVDSNNGVWGMGSAENGQLGNGDFTRVLSPQLIGLPTNGVVVAALAAGNHHSVLCDHQGNVYSCGANERGQLCQGDGIERCKFTLCQTLTGINITRIAAGANHTLLIDDSKQLYTCGEGSEGQLCVGGVDGMLTPQPVPFCRVKQAVAGGASTLIMV